MTSVRRFQTVLVANRGEIARRVIRTLRKQGIRSVAVYSDADASAPFVSEADVAVRIGPAPAARSYLDIDAVIAAAIATGADAVHPGYGFLSENAEFAHACDEAGITFIGPGERALSVMGDKIRSKAHVAAHGVPVVPGFSAAGMSDGEIAESAESTGYPLLIKPSAGGGGKGMQVVEGPDELVEALRTARRIAAASFGDDTLLLERLITRPRHIEVQVFADHHGGVISLGERECTLQRRHQKVIEESPSPIIDAATRDRLGAAACAAAASVDYVGAGTVEFLVSADSPDEFFFIEMNTRLQVEHPVTELVTGLDLVALQLTVATGAPLPLAQDDVRAVGHAIEARVYAEDPTDGFLPSTGDVLLFQPATGVRTDSAVETGSRIGSDYDPMIAKVIAGGQDRAAALAALDDALADTVVLGVQTNIGFLRALLADDDVRAGTMDTGLIDRLPRYVRPRPTARALDAAGDLVGTLERATEAVRGPESPWRSLVGMRVNAASARSHRRFLLSDGDVVSVAAEVLDTTGAGTDAGSDAQPNSTTAAVRDADGRVWVHDAGVTSVVEPLSRRAALERRLATSARGDAATVPELRAPMPGAVVALLATDGSRVSAGERIVSIEAMKMEHPVIAPHDGTVTLLVAVGDQVRRDQIVARVIQHDADADATAIDEEH